MVAQFFVLIYLLASCLFILHKLYKVSRNLRWIFIARKLCKRYGLRLVYLTEASGSYNQKKSVIRVKPTNSHYFVTFLHELGHHLDIKHRGGSIETYKGSIFSCTTVDKDFVNSTFTMEANASRIAMKILRLYGQHTRENEKYLLYCFNTYVPKRGVPQNIADVASFGYKRITSGINGKYHSST